MQDSILTPGSGYPTRNGELLIGGVGVSELLGTFGSPLYVYDGERICEQVKKVQQCFPDFELFYSVKSNPNLSICNLMHDLKLGAEVASGGEVAAALQVGFTPSDIVFAGPGKSEQDLELAISAEIHSINVESEAELARISEIAGRLGKLINVSLRINPQAEITNAQEVMAGGASRFGLDEEKVYQILDRLRSQYVRVIGIHVYHASDILNETEIFDNFSRVFRLIDDFINNTGSFPLTVDFGGGFGIPYSTSHESLNIERLGAKVMQLMSDVRGRTPELNQTRMIIELGRYLVAEAGVYLASIVDFKESRGKRFAIVDGGMHQQIRPVFMNTLHPILIANKVGYTPTQKVDVCGCLCTPLDTLGSDVDLPAVEIGDVVAILNSGAYGFSMSMLNFLSHPWPAEVIVNQGSTYLVRERGTINDLLRGQKQISILGSHGTSHP